MPFCFAPVQPMLFALFTTFLIFQATANGCRPFSSTFLGFHSDTCGNHHHPAQQFNGARHSTFVLPFTAFSNSQHYLNYI
jgi:hypothetical protein